MEFKSQICTTKEQSERLLKLGLKKETADMVWMKELAWDAVAHCTYDAETYMLRPIDYLEGESHRGHIPAWSLHRLLMMYGDNYSFFSLDNAYGELIHAIAIDIEKGTFNKDYLEDKQ